MAQIWKAISCIVASLALWLVAGCGGGDGGSSGASNSCQAGGPPTITLDTPAAGATQLSGHTCNVDTAKIKVVIYVLTNQWYVQPLVAAPYTTISSDGSWANSTHPWDRIVVLLVDPASYAPAATKMGGSK